MNAAPTTPGGGGAGGGYQDARAGVHMAPPADVRQFHFTIFPSLTSPDWRSCDAEWDDVEKIMRFPYDERTKESSPLIKLGRFNGPRADENLVAVTGIEGDYDRGDVSIDEAKARLEAHGIKAVLFTTWKHMGVDENGASRGHRWRVLCPLSKERSPEQREHYVRRLNGALGGALSSESFVPAQGFFFGRNPATDYRAAATFEDSADDDGEFIDLLDDLDVQAMGYTPDTAAPTAIAAPAAGGPATAPSLGHEDWLRDLLDGDDVHGNALRVIARMVAKGLDDATIHAVFDALFDAIAKARGFERAEALCHAGELDRMIAGARKKGFAPMSNEEVKSRMQEFVNSVRAADIPDIPGIVADIARTPFPGAEPRMLLGAIKQKFGNGASIVDLRATLALEQAKLARAAGGKVEGEEEPDQADLARGVITDLGYYNAYHVQGSFWLWGSEGVWRKRDDKAIKQIVQRSLKDDDNLEVGAGLVAGVTDCIKNELYITDAPFEQAGKDRLVNVTNGTLEWTGEEWHLREHRRDDYLITQLGVPFDPEAKAPRFEQYLDEVFAGDGDADDKKTAVLEMIGYSLLPTARYEKFAILVGEGSNGKSVLLDLVGALIGTAQVAAVQPAEFGNKFQRGRLHGRLANLVTELQEGTTIPEDQLKSIVSGELVTAEHKNRDPFEFAPYATCWFGTNHMPHTRDFSNALFRRALILTFNQSFLGREDVHLKERLRAELPGILVLALRAVASVFGRGGFTIPPSSALAAAKWREGTDLVEQFVGECCERGPSAEYRERTADLYSAACKWAEDGRIKNFPSRRAFVERIKRRGLGTPGEHGKGNDRYIFGLRLLSGPGPSGT